MTASPLAASDLPLKVLGGNDAGQAKASCHAPGPPGSPCIIWPSRPGCISIYRRVPGEHPHLPPTESSAIGAGV